MIDINSLNKVFIVAELSANHSGSLETARQTIKAIKRSGADAVKLQTYTPDTMTLNLKNENFLINNGSIWDGKNYYELYEEAHTPWEWHKSLYELANELDLVCFSSPFDKSAVDFLESIDNPIYKIASFEITDLPLIEYVAKKGKPVIISTGIASEQEINDAVSTIKNTGNNKIAILKCTSSYPAPIEDANLLMIQEYKNKYRVTTGLSDHTLGTKIPVIATALGAKIIEKHFILDKTIGGPDASFSLDEEEFSEMVKSIRNTEIAMGKISYTLTDKQNRARAFSRSLYVVKNVKKGQEINHTNVKSLRPNNGLDPKYLPRIVGKKFVDDYTVGTPLKENMIFDER